MVTIDEFFDGNDNESSIAPNQVGYGRPRLAEIAARLHRLEANPAVAWMRVQLHEEMFGDGFDGLDAESVAICTTLTDEEVNMRLDVESLQAEPVWEGLSYDEDDFCDVPETPPGHRIVTLVWD